MAQRPARVVRTLAYLCDGVAAVPGSDLEGRLGAWLDTSRRFVDFAEAHRDKIRRKLRVATEPEAMEDVLAELQAAFLLLADRRFDLDFEAYGSGRRGPDFTVAFRASHRFNLEVTRPRLSAGAGNGEAVVARAVMAKLRQFPASVANALFVAMPVAQSGDQIAATMRDLKRRADGGDAAYFARRGLTPAEFQSSYRRMSVLFVASEVRPGVFGWTNPEARHQLPDGAAGACLTALASAR